MRVPAQSREAGTGGILRAKFTAAPVACAARTPPLRSWARRLADQAEQARREVAAGRLEAALVLDAGCALGDLGFPLPPAPLVFLDVEAVPLALVAAPGHRVLGRSPLGVDELSGERLLVNGPKCSFWMAADIFGPGLERVRAGVGDVCLG